MIICTLQKKYKPKYDPPVEKGDSKKQTRGEAQRTPSRKLILAGERTERICLAACRGIFPLPCLLESGLAA